MRCAAHAHPCYCCCYNCQQQRMHTPVLTLKCSSPSKPSSPKTWHMSFSMPAVICGVMLPVLAQPNSAAMSLHSANQTDSRRPTSTENNTAGCATNTTSYVDGFKCLARLDYRERHPPSACGALCEQACKPVSSAAQDGLCSPSLNVCQVSSGGVDAETSTIKHFTARRSSGMIA